MSHRSSSSPSLSSFSLHVLAMALMLCDHLWATLLPAQEWLTCIGRMAFPIFAFLIAEGFAQTSSVRRYAIRLLIAAVLAEIPFNLMYGSTLLYPFHQNVLWTFLLAVLSMSLLEKVKAANKPWIFWPVAAAVVAADYLVGTIAMVDYFGAGVLTVLVFYFFRRQTWLCRLGQLVCLYVLNVSMLGGYYYSISVAGLELELVQQGFALLALVPIWLYRGRQGYHAKWFQFFCYAFYPLHMLALYALWQWVS